MPKVSVIIPLHNPGVYVRDAIMSVQQQTFRDWELIVIDDASSEDVSWIEKEFPGIKFIRQQRGGVSVARNNGILHSTGEYICFLDQDDAWCPSKLHSQIAVMDADQEVGLCYCWLEIFHDDVPLAELVKRAAARQDSGPPTVALNGLSNGLQSNLYRSIEHFRRSFIVPSTLMLRRSCLAVSGLLDPFIPFSGDFDLIIKIGAHYKVVEIPRPEVLYRKHSGNFSLRYDVCQSEVRQLIDKYRNHANAHGDTLLARDAKRLFTVSRKILATQAFDCSRNSWKQGDLFSFTRHLAKAAYFQPTLVARAVLDKARSAAVQPSQPRANEAGRSPH